MLVQIEHRFTVPNHYRMAEMGVLKPDARVELLDGRMLDLSPMGPLHGSITKRLNKLFNQLSGGRWTLCGSMIGLSPSRT